MDNKIKEIMTLKYKLLLIFCWIFQWGFAQHFSYRNIATKTSGINYTQYTNIKDSEFKDATLVTKYFPTNFSVKGDKNYTIYLQKAIDENNILLMPDFPVLIDDRGLQLRSNTKIFFQKNSLLKLYSSKKSSYAVLKLDGVSDVSIYYPNIVGDRKRHLGKTGQWGMGIWINNSRNVKIFAPKIVDCWGDGIYLGNEGKKAPNENILITNGILDNNRRNGISIISGRNIEINNVFISNTNGHNPQSGIDIEPNSNEDILEGINLLNIETFNNTMNGIVVSIGNLSGKKQRKVNINIDNHKDSYSYLGLSFLISRNNLASTMSNVSGTINLKNLTYNDPGFASLMTYKGKKNNKIAVNIENVKISKQNRRVHFNKEVFVENLNKGVQYKVQ